MMTTRFAYRWRQRGQAAVEFALVSAIFLTLLIGVMEVSRVLFYLNTAAEATRLGARLAVVCNINDPVITQRMVSMLGILSPANIEISYQPASCNIATCESVTVSIAQGQNGLNIDTFVPLIPLTLQMPAFATTLPRESLSSANNSICI